MTLKQIIDQAADLGQQLPDGLYTEVKLWNLNQQPLQALEQAKPGRFQIGANEDGKRVIAYLTIKP